MESIYSGRTRGALAARSLQRQAEQDMLAQEQAQQAEKERAINAQNAMIVAQQQAQAAKEEKDKQGAIEQARLAEDKRRLDLTEARDAQSAKRDEARFAMETTKHGLDVKEYEQRKVDAEKRRKLDEKEFEEKKVDADAKRATKAQADKYRLSARIARNLADGDVSFAKMDKDTPGWKDMLGFKDIAEHADGTITMTGPDGFMVDVTREQLLDMADKHESEALRLTDPMAYEKLEASREGKAAQQERTRALTDETRRKTALEMTKTKAAIIALEGQAKQAALALDDAIQGRSRDKDGKVVTVTPDANSIASARVNLRTIRGQLDEAKSGMSMLEEQMPKPSSAGGGAIKKVASKPYISPEEQAALDRLNARAPAQPALSAQEPPNYVPGPYAPPASVPAPAASVQGDLNGDGVVSEHEKRYNAFDWALKNSIHPTTGQPLSAAQKEQLKARMAEMKPLIIGR